MSLWSGLVRGSRLRWRLSERANGRRVSICIDAVRYGGVCATRKSNHRRERILSISVFIRALLGSSGFGHAYLA
jgi:hypothetical protein